MAVKYFKNASGQYIRHEDGTYMRDEECCCCNCETDGPTADFSYTQTGTDPCTINLSDESVAGACGEIVSWSWKLNGVEFSTSQNPTSVEVEDGDDIELTVTDSAGCIDGAVMEIICGVDCGGCPEIVPPTVTVTAAGFSNNACTLGDCTLFNGTHTLTLTTVGTRCVYEKVIGTGCDSSTTMLISATIPSGVSDENVAVSFVAGGSGGLVVYVVNRGDTCLGEFVLSPTTTMAKCNRPASVTLNV